MYYKVKSAKIKTRETRRIHDVSLFKHRKIMKKIYHGTSEKYIKDILENGIKPRNTEEGNWKEAPSRSDRVYLTDTYPLFFADCAAKNKERCAIIEIEISKLNKKNFRPDEDFIVQVLAAQKQLPKNIDIKHHAATMDIENYEHEWEKSLLHLGNIAHIGTIPVSAITRIALYTSEGPLLAGGDPSITLINHRYTSQKSKTLIDWVFNGTQPDIEFITKEQLEEQLKTNPNDQMIKIVLEGYLWREKWFKESHSKIVEVQNLQIRKKEKGR